jgi:hypothetical protein
LPPCNIEIAGKFKWPTVVLSKLFCVELSSVYISALLPAPVDTKTLLQKRRFSYPKLPLEILWIWLL